MPNTTQSINMYSTTFLHCAEDPFNPHGIENHLNRLLSCSQTLELEGTASSFTQYHGRRDRVVIVSQSQAGRTVAFFFLLYFRLFEQNWYFSGYIYDVQYYGGM